MGQHEGWGSCWGGLWGLDSVISKLTKGTDTAGKRDSCWSRAGHRLDRVRQGRATTGQGWVVL